MQYDAIILDSCFYTTDFDSETVSLLKSVRNVLVSDTFSFELEENKIIIPPGYKDTYISNIRLINRIKRENDVKFINPKRDFDIWQLIQDVSKAYKKFLVLTGNNLLIDKIILNNISIDIYDLNQCKYYYHNDFSVEKTKREFKSGFDEIDDIFSGSHGEISVGSALYSKYGNTVILGDELNSGTEASIYYLQGNEDYVAKIFKSGKLTYEKYKNIKNIVEKNITRTIRWAIFPIELLYSEEECINPVGYIENAALGFCGLENHPLYYGDLSEIYDNHLDHYCISFTVDICISLVRQILFLNSIGFFISDFNIRNFAVHDDDTSRIQMWDTDSFGYLDYFSGYCSGDKTTKDYNTQKKSGALEFCAESLYILVFRLLTLGDTPLYDSGEFKYDYDDYPLLRRKFVPDNLWNLFEAVFHGNKAFSSELLLKELTEAQRQFECYEIEDRSYYEIISSEVSFSKPTKSHRKKIYIILAIVLFLIVGVLGLLYYMDYDFGTLGLNLSIPGFDSLIYREVKYVFI